MKFGSIFKMFPVKVSLIYSSSQSNIKPKSIKKIVVPKEGVVNAIHEDKFNLTNTECFLALMRDDIIQQFLQFDHCFKLADKYLLSMVFVYFIRAKLPHNEYSRTNFFAALYLAHDLEEDDEDLKCHVMRWGLGKSQRGDVEYFMQIRDNLFMAMDFQACVSLQCCLQVFKSIPDCSLWQRSRSPAHSGAIRSYEPEEECDRCHLSEIQYYGTDLESDSGCEESDMPPCKKMKFSDEE